MSTKVLAIIGCGNLGSAILEGLLATYSSTSPAQISRILLTVRSQIHQEKIILKAESLLLDCPPVRRPDIVFGLSDNNSQYCNEADIVLLACKPYMLTETVGDVTTALALLGSGDRKILVSLLGGVSINQIVACTNTAAKSPTTGSCTVVRAIVNIAAKTQHSMSIVSQHSSVQPSAEEQAVGALLRNVGQVRYLPEAQLNAASALSASAVAIYAAIIVAAANGSTDPEPLRGTGALSPDDALLISSSAAASAAELIRKGIQPSEIQDMVATKGGSTRTGLNVCQELKVFEAISKAIETCIVATEGLAKQN